jgi:riboflavin synthase
LFTGLVEDIGTVELADHRSDAVRLAIVPARIPVDGLTPGESIAVDGICLTVTECQGTSFAVFAGSETLRRTTAGALVAGSRVNLERALRLSDRLGGHLVQGHVDAVATVLARDDRGETVEITFSAPRALLRGVVEKGSVTVDGVSLTVSRVDGASFAVSLIPYTLEHTTLSDKHRGARVNLEVDLIGKYVQRLVQPYGQR